MNRRGFLKGIAQLTAGAIILPSVRIVLPDEELLIGEQWVASVREIGHFDIHHASGSAMIVRHDICSGGERWFVEHLIESREELPRIRRMSAIRLGEKLIERGWRIDDLMPLPFPRGVATVEELLA